MNPRFDEMQATTGTNAGVRPHDQGFDRWLQQQSVEPWHVMGEEGSSAGTVRCVDSSVERVALKVSGLINPRRVLTCKGVAVPLQPTGRSGEFVCGVRYRAWLPPSALHPSIGIDAPLTFNLVDQWMPCSLGGC